MRTYITVSALALFSAIATAAHAAPALEVPEGIADGCPAHVDTNNHSWRTNCPDGSVMFLKFAPDGHAILARTGRSSAPPVQYQPTQQAPVQAATPAAQQPAQPTYRSPPWQYQAPGSVPPTNYTQNGQQYGGPAGLPQMQNRPTVEATHVVGQNGSTYDALAVAPPSAGQVICSILCPVGQAAAYAVTQRVIWGRTYYGNGSGVYVPSQPYVRGGSNGGANRQ